MIGLAWQRRVRMAAMRLPVTNSPQSGGGRQRQITLPSAAAWCSLSLKDYRFCYSMLECPDK